MSGISAMVGASTSIAGPVGTQADRVIKQGTASVENGKIDKSSKEFEAILLGSWLQQAEQSFGSLPGGDDEDDADPGRDQFQGMAMQSLGTSMSNSGGIGIAKMIASHLHKAEDARVAPATDEAEHGKH